MGGSDGDCTAGEKGQLNFFGGDLHGRWELYSLLCLCRVPPPPPPSFSSTQHRHSEISGTGRGKTQRHPQHFATVPGTDRTTAQPARRQKQPAFWNLARRGSGSPWYYSAIIRPRRYWYYIVQPQWHACQYPYWCHASTPMAGSITVQVACSSGNNGHSTKIQTSRSQKSNAFRLLMVLRGVCDVRVCSMYTVCMCDLRCMWVSVYTGAGAGAPLRAIGHTALGRLIVEIAEI
jgi:hypothetical protein